MGSATNVNGQAQASQTFNAFMGNLTSATYTGKDGALQAVSDGYGALVGGMYQGIAMGANSARAIPIVGFVVAATIDLACHVVDA